MSDPLKLAVSAAVQPKSDVGKLTDRSKKPAEQQIGEENTPVGPPESETQFTASSTGIWVAEEQISIPATDIVTYAFQKCVQWDKKIFADATDGSKYLCTDEVRDIVRKLVKGFKELGLEQGDCVCIHSSNNIVYPLLWLGVVGAGGCVAGSNPAYTTPELTHLLTTTNTLYIISYAECLPNILAAATECQIPYDRLFVFATPGQQLYVPDGCRSWEELVSHGDSDWKRYHPNEAKYEEIIAVLGMTSGTMGLPKAAELSHKALIAQCEIMLHRRAEKRTSCYEVLQLICLPIFHSFAMPLGIILPLRQSMTTYFLPRFNSDLFITAVSAFNITEIPVVPPILAALLNFQMEENPKIFLRSLRHIICAGAPTNSSIQTRLYARLHADATVAQCWGMTEMGWATTFASMEREYTGSVGRLLANVELKIIDDNGDLVTEDLQYGEAYLRSPGSFNGYRNDQIANANAFNEEGFYRTGDRVYMCQGKVYIDGRIKDIMKVKGWQVSPEELENILLEHPDVVDAAVAGVTSQTVDGLEMLSPQAFVVRAEKAEGYRFATASEIMAFVAAKVVTYKQLTGGVVFLSEIPRSAAGKILRRQLVEVQDENEL